MNNTATTNIDGVPPVTALNLVNIAGVLIDSVDIDDNPNESTRMFRTGVKAGIVSMCKASTSAINAFGALSLAKQAGPAPAGQHGDAQSNQAVTPKSDGRDQHPGTAQEANLIFSKLPHANLILGEKRAGSIIDIATGVIYDVMLMPGELECVTWAEAKAEITAAGGDLPTRDEILLLHKLLGSLAFRDHQYWTDEKVKFIGEPNDSISYFCDGWFEITEAADRMHARGVRRICVGDVAHDGADPIDDSYVVVSAPTVLTPQEIVSPDSGVTAERMAKLVTMQRRACDLLEAMGGPHHIEAAGDLRCATGDLWDVVQEQVAINALPPTLDSWMTTPAGLARVLVDALRGERIDEPSEYNDAVEDCIVAVVGTISAGAGAGADKDDAVIPALGPNLSDRPDLQQLRDRMRADLTTPAPQVLVEDIFETLAQLRSTADEAIDDDATAVCRRAARVIEGLLPHAGDGVLV